MHRPLMILALILNICAFFVILSDLNWKWVQNDGSIAFTHSIFGILTISFTFIQVNVLLFEIFDQ